MAGKFSIPRFGQEDLESTQELPQLPEDFEPIPQPISQSTPLIPCTPQELYDPSEEYDPDEELPDDFIDTALRVLQETAAYCGKHWKKILTAACALVLMVILVIAGSLAAGSRDPYDDKILNNVMIADVLVGGMTKDQATAALNASLGNAYITQSMTVDLGDQVLKLEPSQTGAKLNVQAAVEAAYAHGRTGTDAERQQAYQASLSGNYILAVLPYLELDEDYIRQTLTQIEAASVSELAQPSYTLEGEVTNFSTEVFNPAASGQSLVITTGTPQVEFDASAVYEMVIDAYSLGQFRVEAQGPVTTQEPEKLDLDAVYQEFYLEPKAPTLDMTDFDTIPGSYGREFDLGNAKLLLAQAGYGETIRIPMTYPAPEGDPTAVLFRDVLGQWSTDVPNDDNWKQNMRLACKSIDGIELNPGETFSFNAVVGKRSESRGYLAAASCDDTQTDASIGGGVCQVASTIYVAALLSDLDILDRTAHDAPLSFTALGLDAKVDWEGADMSLRNSSIYPIRIEAEFSGGRFTVSIVGTDLRSYRTEIIISASETTPPKTIYQEYDYDNEDGYEDGDVIQPGRDGCQVKTYRHKYDKTSGDLTGRDYIATSSYPSQDKIIAQVAPPVIETEATDPTSETIDLPDDVSGNIEAVG